MRGSLNFDPGQHDFGPATLPIRQALSTWVEIDWFTPPRNVRAISHKLFAEHNRLARAHLPKTFDQSLDIVSTTGGWAEFAALCEQVRKESQWDWKYYALKTLTRAHSEAHGWLLQEQMHLFQDVPDLQLMCAHVNGHVMWGTLGPMPAFEQSAAAHTNSASFYYHYCYMDLVDCLEWQLAEPSAALTANPFFSLLRCYEAGYYPFSFGPSLVVMFEFTRPR